MKIEKKIFLYVFLITAVIFFTILFSLNDNARAEIYQGRALSPDKKVIEAIDKKIVSPGQKWTWYNSWVVIRKQPSEFFRRKISPPYTLEYSFRTEWFEEIIWLEYSYMVWRHPLPEYNNRGIKKIETWIWKNFKHSARVMYIEKKAEKFYVVVYRRNNQKKRDIPKISGYPLFNFENLLVSDKGIEVKFKKFIDPWGRKIIEPLKIPMKDVFLLNPALIYEPSEMEKISIPYSFFAHKFIYEHPLIKKFAFERGDPMIIEIKNDGIIVKFRKR